MVKSRIILLVAGFLYSFLSAQQFQIPLMVADSSDTQPLYFGVNTAGTNNFDPALDTLCLANNCRLAYFFNNGSRYSCEIKDNSLNEKQYEIRFTAGIQPRRLSWNAAGLQSLGSFRIVDVISGTLLDVDMTATDSLDLTDPLLQYGLKIKVIPSPPLSTFSQEVGAGWNLLGLPLQPGDNSYLAAYPNAIP
ncbi:MAG: hypothetical protein WAN36_01735, partial [Calditrichia bacterium]